MTDELVKRLREEALSLHVAGWRDPAGGQDTTISAVLADDAADRIEALTAERDRLREAMDNRLEAITAEDQFHDRSLTITGSTANLRQLLEADWCARAPLKGETP